MIKSELYRTKKPTAFLLLTPSSFVKRCNFLTFQEVQTNHYHSLNDYFLSQFGRLLFSFCLDFGLKGNRLQNRTLANQNCCKSCNNQMQFYILFLAENYFFMVDANMKVDVKTCQEIQLFFYNLVLKLTSASISKLHGLQFIL